MFSVPKRCLKLAGNFEYENVPKFVPKTVQFTLVIALSLCFMIFFVLIPRKFDDIEKTASAFGLGTTALLALVKTFNFYFKKQQFYDLMKAVESFGYKGM